MTTSPTVTEAEVIGTMREHLEGLFPKVCSNCHRHFASLREYILITERVGSMVSYDAELGDWNTTRPTGTMALANCPCGTTLAVGTEGIPLSRRLLMLDWIKSETQRRGVSWQELLEYLRDQTRKQVLAESCQEGTSKNTDEKRRA